jgi:hypothetical protein
MHGLNLVDEKNYAAAEAALKESAVLYEQVQDEWGEAQGTDVPWVLFQ